MKQSTLAAEFIRQSVLAVDASAEIDCCHTAGAALMALRERSVQLGIFGLNLPDVDGLDLVEDVALERLVWRILVVTRRIDERARTLLRRLPIDGFFDECGGANEPPGELRNAIARLAEGGTGFRKPVPPAICATRRNALETLFTPHQLRVFAVLGAGCGDEAAAEELELTIETVKWHRKCIMAKLGVHSVAELTRAALERGVTRIDGARVLRPGFERAIAAHRESRKQRAASAA